MEKITHEFKAGDWVDTRELSEEQKNSFCHLIKSMAMNENIDIKNYPMVAFSGINLEFYSSKCSLNHDGKLTWSQLTAPLEDKPFTHDMIRDWLDGTEFTGAIDARMSGLQEAVSKFDLAEIGIMDRLENKKPKRGFVSKAVPMGLNELSSIPNVVGHAVERHDQEIDSGDNYNDALDNIKQGLCEEAMKKVPIGCQGNQPYTPQVGEECEISNCGNPYIWCKIEYIGKDLCVVSHEIHKEQHYHLNSAKFRKLKTKRDICMDAIKEGLHPSVYEAQKEYYGYAVDKLIRLGFIK